jgi:hypothetical protein
MVETAHNTLLNDLVIAIYRSLVLFTDEVSPWASGAEEALRQEVAALAQRQRDDVGRLVELLQDRGEPVEFGHYPHAFTSYHFVAVTFLAKKIIAGQRVLVQQLEAAADALANDPAAQDVVQSVAKSQREGLVKLLGVIPGA